MRICAGIENLTVHPHFTMLAEISAVALAQILAQQRASASTILVSRSTTRQTYTRVVKITCRASTFSGILSPRIILPCKIAYGFDAINNVTRWIAKPFFGWDANLL